MKRGNRAGSLVRITFQYCNTSPYNDVIGNIFHNCSRLSCYQSQQNRSLNNQSINIFIQVSIYSSNNQSINQSIYLSRYQYIHPTINLFIQQSIYVDTLIVSPPRSCIMQEWSGGSGHHLLFWIHGCISMLVITVFKAYRAMVPFTASGSWFQPLTTLIEKKFFLCFQVCTLH